MGAHWASGDHRWTWVSSLGGLYFLICSTHVSVWLFSDWFVGPTSLCAELNAEQFGGLCCFLQEWLDFPPWPLDEEDCFILMLLYLLIFSCCVFFCNLGSVYFLYVYFICISFLGFLFIFFAVLDAQCFVLARQILYHLSRVFSPCIPFLVRCQFMFSLALFFFQE
jgi:hypothetical protein